MTAAVRPKLVEADRIARVLSPLVRRMMVEQLSQHKAVRQSEIDAEISQAAKALGRALDVLEVAKFTAREPGARIALEKAATRLFRVMVKHGRLP